MIDVLGKSNQLPQAMKLLTTMKEKGISPSDITYNSLIDAYGKNKDLVGAITILNILSFFFFPSFYYYFYITVILFVYSIRKLQL